MGCFYPLLPYRRLSAKVLGLYLMEQKTNSNPLVEALFKAGAHFAYGKTRRHPSVSPFIFGAKNRVEIFDLEATSTAFVVAADVVRTLGKEGKMILFVGGKSEARETVVSEAGKASQPYVAGRFIGGTLTNFPQIRKRIEKLEQLLAEKEGGELSRYTKKERLLIDRDIARLTKDFGGIVSMKHLPAAVVVVDPKREYNVVREATQLKIPVIALLNSDCNLKEVTYPVPGNDSLKSSIAFFLKEMAEAYLEGKKAGTTAL
jgi:small subunit ribosomal protein S2